MAMSSGEISVLPHVIRPCVISSPLSASDAASATSDELSTTTMSAYSYLQQSKRTYMNSNSSYKDHLMAPSAAGKPSWHFRHHVDQSTSPCTTNHQYHSRFQKVFADEEKGILCYRNGMGEIICEGRDEGPYYEPPAGSRVSSTMCSIPANAIIHRVKPSCSFREKTQDLKTIEFMGTLFCEGRDEG